MGCIKVTAMRIGKGINVSCGLVCSVNKIAYLRVSPKHIFLMPGNDFKDDVLVYSNVVWQASE